MRAPSGGRGPRPRRGPRRLRSGAVDPRPTTGATCEHIFYERRLDYKSILSRSGRAVAHDEERRAFERLGKRAAWSKFGYLGSSRGLSFFRDGSRGRECTRDGESG